MRKSQCGDPNVNCVHGNSENQKRDKEKIDKLFAEIAELSKSVACENPKEWDFIAIGSKACGGPTGFIAYSTKIDVTYYLAKVKEHEIAEKKYNLKWGIISDCAIIAPPVAIVCNKGEAELIY